MTSPPRPRIGPLLRPVRRRVTWWRRSLSALVVVVAGLMGIAIVDALIAGVFAVAKAAPA
jgi:hypothetical protein